MSEQRGKRGDPNYKQVSGQVPRDLAVRFKARCAEQEVSVSDTLELLIRYWLERPPDSPLDAEGNKGDAPSLFLRKVVNGIIPSDHEIEALARTLDVPENSLYELRSRLFPGDVESSTRSKRRTT
jgi:hypothetical protein